MAEIYDLPRLAALRSLLMMGAEEPAASFASRLAVRNGVDSAQALCQQIILKLDGLRRGDEKAIEVLAILAELLPEKIFQRTFRKKAGHDRDRRYHAVP